MNISEHIADMLYNKDLRVERRNQITRIAASEGRTLAEVEQSEFDELQGEIVQLDSDISRYKQLETEQMRTATPIKGAPAILKHRSRDEDFQGQNFTRMVIAKALGNLHQRSPVAIANERWGKSSPRVVEVIKADVTGGGSGAGEWGNELVSRDTWMGDFQEYLYGKTIYNQLPLREVPANITIKGQDGAATGYWVGESKAIPVTSADFNDVTLTPLKVATIAVASNEWLRDSSPSAEMLVRDALVEAARQRIDSTFISALAAVPGVSPAGILYNIPATTSAGTDGDAVANDFKEMMYRFTTARNSGGQWVIMNPALATGLSMLRNALDQYEFPDISEDGGTIFKKPVVTGDNVNANHVIMLKPSDIYRIGMGTMEVSMSQQATIEMDSAPGADTDTPTAPTGKTVSMFQTESTAFKVVQSINFARRRESAVAWINDADYGGAIST